MNNTRRGSLVLTRKPSQKILIGDDIEITLIGVYGNCAKILIKAPEDISVDREEIREKKVINGHYIVDHYFDEEGYSYENI